MELAQRGDGDLLVARGIAGGAMAYLMAYLEGALSMTRTGCRDTVEVRPPSEEAGWFLSLPDGTTVSAVTVGTRTGFRAGVPAQCLSMRSQPSSPPTASVSSPTRGRATGRHVPGR